MPSGAGGSQAAPAHDQYSSKGGVKSGAASLTVEKSSTRKRLREDDSQDTGNDSESDEGDGLGVTGSITVGGVGKGKKLRGTRLYVFLLRSWFNHAPSRYMSVPTTHVELDFLFLCILFLS